MGEPRNLGIGVIVVQEGYEIVDKCLRQSVNPPSSPSWWCKASWSEDVKRGRFLAEHAELLGVFPPPSSEELRGGRVEECGCEVQRGDLAEE